MKMIELAYTMASTIKLESEYWEVKQWNFPVLGTPNQISGQEHTV